MSTPNPRDERLIQDRPGGPVRMVSAGAGRELIDTGDALEGADPAAREQLRQRPAIGPSPLPEGDPNVGRKDVMPAIDS